MPARRHACRRQKPSRGARAACVQPLEPRRLMSVMLQSENVAVPQDPYLLPYANFLYFSGQTADGVELWENNGGIGLTHTSGAEAVRGPGSTNPRDVTLLRNTALPSYNDIYFTGDDPSVPGSRALYKRDVNAGLQPKLRTFDSVGQVMVLNDAVVFVADGGDGAGRELWRTDGTPAGTMRVTDIAPGAADAAITGLTQFNNRAVFSADDGLHGAEPWITDGTPAGTAMVMDLNAGPAGSAPRDFLHTGFGVHFNATTAEHGSELWATEGTLATTRLVADAAPGPGSSGLTPALPRGSGSLYSFTRGDVPLELYHSDGASGVTTLVKRITDAPAGGRAVRAAFFTDRDGSGNSVFLFTAADPATGLEPWRSDGTAAGTYLLKDINPGPAGSLDPDEGVAQVVGGRAFFSASDGSGTRLLWTTIGTAAGTLPAAGAGGRLAYNPTKVTAAWRNAFFAAGASAAPDAPRTLWVASQDGAVPSVSGRVYQDLDGDAVNDYNDGAVAGATVYADLDEDARPDPGEPFARSGAGGEYVLPLEAGAYTIRVVLPAGYTHSGGNGEPVTLAAGQYKGAYFRATADSGAAVTAFHDADGDGVKDPGFTEAALPGRTIWVDGDNDGRFDGGEASVVTDSEGVARFALPPGDYTFREFLPLGWGGHRGRR